MRVFKRAFVVIAAAVIPVGVSGFAAGAAQATASAPPESATSAGTSFSTPGSLAGVAAVSKSNAWAVGYAGKNSAPRVLMLHWNGTRWSRVTRPSVLTAGGGLTAITAVGPANIWAVGYTGLIGTGKEHSLLLHWNGSAWRQVTSPAPVAGGHLAGVTATAKSGWAVGFVNTTPSAPPCCAGTPLVFRWNGSKWSRQSTPLGMGAGLNGVAITAPNRAWAIGGPLAMITGAVAQWNGKAWAWARDPIKGPFRPLSSIVTRPRGAGFMVGTNNNSTPVGVSARWNGTAWRQVPVHAPTFSELNGVTFAPGGAAWAAGNYFSGGSEHPLVMRWNGSAWTRIAAPGSRELLNGLAFSAAGYGWAVGNTTSAQPRTAILHWNGKAWG